MGRVINITTLHCYQGHCWSGWILRWEGDYNDVCGAMDGMTTRFMFKWRRDNVDWDVSGGRCNCSEGWCGAVPGGILECRDVQLL